MTTPHEVNGARVVLDRAAILAARDLQPMPLDMPEWGGVVYVRGLSAAEAEQHARDAIEAQKAGKEIAELVMVRAVLTCTCDASGAPLFTSADLGALANKSAPAISRVFRVIERLSGMLAGDAAKN
jgi:hypothetical protein